MAKKLKNTIVVDSLRLLLNGRIKFIDYHNPVNIVKVNKLLTLTKRNSLKHPAFTLCYELKYSDKKIGYIHFDNNGTYNYKNTEPIILSFHNNLLYEKDYFKIISPIIKMLGIEFIKYDYMEIAIDGFNIIKKINTLFKSANYELLADIKVKPDFNKKLKVNVGYHLGSPKSEKYITIYKKGINCKGKPYIEEFWKKNFAIEAVEEIERCELRCDQKALLSFSKDFKELENCNYLGNYFYKSAGKYITFYHKENRLKLKEIISWKQFLNIEIEKQSQTKEGFSVYKYMTTIKNLVLEYYKSNIYELAYALAYLVINYQLTSWFIKSLSRWIYEIV